MRFLLDIANFGVMQIIVFGCLFMGGYYFSSYDDGSHIEQSISDTESQIQSLEININKKQKEFDNLIMFKKEIDLKEESVSYFLNYIPNQLSSIDVFSLLNNEAKVTGVNIEDKEDQTSIEKEPYEILKVRLKISGAFPQVVLFLSHLTNQKRILIVDNISMNISENKRLISADLDIFAFRYEGYKKKEDGENKGEKNES